MTPGPWGVEGDGRRLQLFSGPMLRAEGLSGALIAGPKPAPRSLSGDGLREGGLPGLAGFPRPRCSARGPSQGAGRAPWPEATA
eukprot:2564532-Alexandrium_andersonii.AAC.1